MINELTVITSVILIIFMLVIIVTNKEEYENMLDYKIDNNNFKKVLLKNPEKLTKKLFKTSSTILDKMKDRHTQYYKKKISPIWKFGKDYGKYNAHDITDKTVMFSLITELGIPLPKQYYSGTFQNIPWKTIPKKCVIKPSGLWSAQGVYLFVNNIEKTTGKTILFSDRKKFIEKDMKSKIDNTTWIIEEYLEDYDSKYDRARDFKCYVAGGKVWFIVVYVRNSKKSKNKSNNRTYTRNWIPFYRKWDAYEMSKEIVKKPKDLHKLIEYAEKIASKIDCFLRLDFYMTKRGPVFGEFTTTPNAGQYINEGAIALSQLMELFPDKLY